MVHSASRWMRGLQVKLWVPLRTRAITQCLRGVFMTRCCTNPHLPYLTLLWPVHYRCWKVWNKKTNQKEVLEPKQCWQKNSFEVTFKTFRRWRVLEQKALAFPGEDKGTPVPVVTSLDLEFEISRVGHWVEIRQVSVDVRLSAGDHESLFTLTFCVSTIISSAPKWRRRLPLIKLCFLPSWAVDVAL